LNGLSEIRQPFFEDRTFCRLLIAIPLKMCYLTKMDFGWPNVEIGQKIANGQPLFLALVY